MRGSEAVIPIPRAIQTKYRYLASDAPEPVCESTEIQPGLIEGVAARPTAAIAFLNKEDITACHYGLDRAEKVEYNLSRVVCF